MRITLKMEGGMAHFPGLAQPLTVDTGSLPAPEREAVEALAADARRFLPAPADADRAGADRRSYELTLEQDGAAQTVRASDPLAPELAALVKRVRALSRSQARAK